VKLGLARNEARADGIDNVEFRRADAGGSLGKAEFDVAYARFLLTHLSDPAGCVVQMLEAIRPGGLLVVEDIDCSGSFCYPANQAFSRWLELYTATVRRRGADPDIGPRSPLLLLDAGFERVGMNIVQPAGLEGEVKHIIPLTVANIADAVVSDQLATREEVEEVVEELYEFARNPRTIVSMPRIVQAWGYRG
jgi:SAM-dependent methyltransferase